MKKNLLIVGDSMTHCDGSWTNIYQNEVDINWEPRFILNIMAWPGRSIKSFDFPSDAMAWARTPAIYFLGGNDAKDKSQTYRTKMLPQLFDMHKRGFDPHLVLPPRFDDVDGIDDIREYMKSAAVFFGWPYVDTDDVFDETQTSDGVHPLPALSEIIGKYIKEGFDI